MRIAQLFNLVCAIIAAVFAAVLLVVASPATASPGDIDIPAGGAYKIGGSPVLYGGPTGEFPTIGTDGTGSVTIRAAAGETISGWLGGDWVFFAEGGVGAPALLNVNGDLLAAGVITAPSPIATADVALDRTISTLRVDASAGPVTVDLPCAEEAVGRRYTVKKVDLSGNPVRLASPRAGCAVIAHIDDAPTQEIATPWGFLTIEGFGVFGGSAGWIVVAR